MAINSTKSVGRVKPRVQEITPEGNALCALARDGDLDGLLDAIDNQQMPVDAKGLNEFTALISASQKGNTDMVHALLNRGANPNAADFDGRSCLSYAVSAGMQCKPTLRALLDAGADITAQDTRRRTPIDKAKQLNNAFATEMIFQYSRMPLVGEEVSKAALQQPNEAELTALQNPQTWHDWPRISTALAANGERFSKDEWLAAGGAGDVSMLERAVQCRAFDAVVADMYVRGETLTLDDMLVEDKPAPWVAALGESQQLGKLLQSALWQDKSAEELSTLRMAIPAEQRGQLQNYFQLKTQLSQQQQQGVGR